jgi:hypothetical protein
MNRSFNTLLLIYWFAVVTLASFLLSCLSFFVPFHDIGEYSLRELLFEIRYYFFPTLLIFLGGGYLAALLFFTVGAQSAGRFLQRGTTRRGNWGLLLLNLLLLLSPFAVWLLLGLDLNEAFSKVVIPSYVGVAIMMHMVLLRKSIRHSI